MTSSKLPFGSHGLWPHLMGRSHRHECPPVADLRLMAQRSARIPIEVRNCGRCAEVIEEFTLRPRAHTSESGIAQNLRNFVDAARPLAKAASRLDITAELPNVWEDYEDILTPWFDCLNDASDLRVYRYIICGAEVLRDPERMDTEEARLSRWILRRPGYVVRYLNADDIGAAVGDVAIFSDVCGERVVQLSEKGPPFRTLWSNEKGDVANMVDTFAMLHERRYGSCIRDLVGN